jgi:hypothetical protein
VVQAKEEIKKMLTGEESEVFDDEQIALLEEINHHITHMSCRTQRR